MALKIVVLAPMPSAKVNTTMTVKPGRLSSIRNANRMSCSMLMVFFRQAVSLSIILESAERETLGHGR